MAHDPSALASITSAVLSAQIDPLGAQLFTLRDSEGRDLLWDGDPKFWTGRSPILFPIIGMLVNEQYRLEGETYHLPKHGFARHKPFELVEHTDGAARFVLKTDAETRRAYPFEFELDLRFVLDGPTLTVTSTVKNVDEKALYASFGFHPALRWPLPYGLERSEHRVTFDREEPAPIRRIDRQGLVTPDEHPTPIEDRVLTLRDDLFMDDALIFDRIESRKVRYGAGSGPHLEVEFPGTSYLGVWTKPGAGFICIEPWHGIADPEGFKGDFRDKPGVFKVAAGAVREITMSITLHS